MNTTNEQIEELKYKLTDRYIILILSIMGVYAFIFAFYIHDKVMFWYLLSGIVFLGYSYSLIRRKFPIKTIVNLYLITAPLYNFYIMLAFWNNSVASFCWLLPIPLGAYIFLTKREVFAYSIYILMIIAIGYITANSFSFDFPQHTQKEVLFTDILLIISNILIVTLLVFYKDKIRKLEILLHFEKSPQNWKDEKNNSEGALENRESLENLFLRIEDCMTRDLLFKDIKFNLSALSVALSVNNTYISKAIRYKGYPNFNSYLNTHRINYVKELFNEVDFQKSTLMYIYTNAGFSNQSTFNRVFKQIEGITPSEYFQKNLKHNGESNN